MNAPSTRSPRGFTLIELMVALAVLGILLSCVYGTFFSVMRSIHDWGRQDDTVQIARVVMEQITRDLAMAFYRTETGRQAQPTHAFIGRDGTVGEFPRDRVDFTTASHVLVRDGRPEGDVAEVSYYIDDTYSDRSLLVRREDPTPDDDFSHGGTLRVLAGNVVGLNFRYRPQLEDPLQPPQRAETEKDAAAGTETEEKDAEEDWRDTWNAEKEQGVPELVEVTLTVLDGDGIEHDFSTTVRLNPYTAERPER